MTTDPHRSCNVEQIDVTAFDDQARGVKCFICSGCQTQYEVPFDWDQHLRSGEVYPPSQQP
jgi:hypothetical protein